MYLINFANFIFLVKSLGLFSKIKLINFDEFYNFLRGKGEIRLSEIGQISIFYFFSIMYIKLENCEEKKAFMLEIVPRITAFSQNRDDFLYFSLNIEI